VFHSHEPHPAISKLLSKEKLSNWRRERKRESEEREETERVLNDYFLQVLPPPPSFPSPSKKYLFKNLI
jgi:hypothetical protein